MRAKQEHRQRALRWASEIFLSRHKCSWKAPVRRLFATVLRKKTFIFLPMNDSVTVECSKCGERGTVTGQDIYTLSSRL